MGVYIGSGIGGFDVIEREHTALLQGGPRRISPFFIPAAIVNLASGQSRTSLRRQRTELGHRHSLLFERARHRRLLQDRPPLRADVMISGGSEAAITPHGRGRIRGHARAFHTQ